MDNIKQKNVFEELKALNPGLYALYEKAVAIIVAKNHDYTVNSTDFYHNFNASEEIGIPGWKAVYIRLGDKLNRIKTFIKTNVLKVTDESFVDTCVDIANYFLIMADMWLIFSRQLNSTLKNNYDFRIRNEDETISR